MATLSIVDFLNARLAEDEATALGVPTAGAPWHGQWVNDQDHALRTVNDHVLTYGHHGEPMKPGLLDHIVRHDPARVLREVEAKRAILKHEVPIDHAEWKLSGSESWFLSGPGFFAECWSDSTVNAWISDVPDGPTLDTTGVVSKDNLAGCQAFAESWIREQLSKRSPVVRALAAIYSDHPNYRAEWRP
jgi:hypothetical protein